MLMMGKGDEVGVAVKEMVAGVDMVDMLEVEFLSARVGWGTLRRTSVFLKTALLAFIGVTGEVFEGEEDCDEVAGGNEGTSAVEFDVVVGCDDDVAGRVSISSSSLSSVLSSSPDQFCHSLYRMSIASSCQSELSSDSEEASLMG